ncbi:importin-4-like isoform X4 [Dromaius novaehollandiae]|uniref:importin-4-like isoform X4 n=1 Tax=Dromaius novaehollandiae TaxID=8790 RepID=UPI00311EE428
MEEDGEEEEELLEVEVGGAYAQELEEACEALGEVAEHCGAAFLPYVEPSLEAMLELLQFPQAGVRGAAYTSLGCLCVGLYPPGDPGPHHDPARQAAAGRAAGALAGGAGAERGPGAAGGALGALGRVLGRCPPAAAAPPARLPPLCRLLRDVLAGQVPCLQPGAGEEEEDEEEEQAEAAAEVRELAGEVLVALAEAVGGELAPHLDELLPLLLARLEPRCSVGERSWAAATLAGVGGALGVASAPLLPRLVPALGAAAGGDAHPEVRANALHALGRLAAAAGPALGPGRGCGRCWGRRRRGRGRGGCGTTRAGLWPAWGAPCPPPRRGWCCRCCCRRCRWPRTGRRNRPYWDSCWGCGAPSSNCWPSTQASWCGCAAASWATPACPPRRRRGCGRCWGRWRPGAPRRRGRRWPGCPPTPPPASATPCAGPAPRTPSPPRRREAPDVSARSPRRRGNKGVAERPGVSLACPWGRD